MNSKQFECGLGVHEYTIPDKKYPVILICKHCKRFGHYKDDYGHECWVEYNDERNELYYRNNEGYECWHKYDNEGNGIHYKSNTGYERWLHNKLWVNTKPENWEYENINKGEVNVN